jgi:hypothetical protein
LQQLGVSWTGSSRQEELSGRRDDSDGSQEETNCLLTPFLAEETLVVEVL